jgi:hypothetical protein
VIQFEIPVRTVSESNGREHWARKARRVSLHRGTARILARSYCADFDLPAVVRIARVAPRELDDDNLRGALKAIRDGIADAFGVKDNDPRIEWQYAQERGKPKAYSVRITITPKAAT